MSVQEQTPFIEYECNGVTKVFPLNFDCHDSDHLIVQVDDVLSAAGSWDLQNKSVVFRVAPKAKSRLTIQRNTPLERLINYSSYDNSMLPQVFNQDFDRVWYKLQEHNQQITYSLNAIDDIYSIANEALGKANQSIEDITEINKHLAKFSNSAGYVYARQVVGKDGKTQEALNTEARPISTGGTGATTAEEARTNLDVFSKAQVNALIATGGEGEIIGISGGGTGAATAEEARANLNVYSKQEVNTELNKKLNKNDLKPATVADLGVVKVGKGLKITETGELSVSSSGLPIGTYVTHQGKRSTLPIGQLPQDGHTYNRVDYPELWALIESGRFATVSDTSWRGAPALRGNFTKGNGTSTFRVPDLNGAQNGSIPSLFLRGSDTDSYIGGVESDAQRRFTAEIQNIPGGSHGAGGVWGSWNTDGQTTGGIERIKGRAGVSNFDSSQDGLIGFRIDTALTMPTADENRPKSTYIVHAIVAKASFVEDPPEGVKVPVIVGGNDYEGSQRVKGNIEATGSITTEGDLNGNIKHLLNANGDAPIAACRAWVCVDTSTTPPTILGSFNVSSVVANGTGDYTVNFTKRMPTANYAVLFGVSDAAGGNALLKVKSSGSTSTSPPQLQSVTQVRLGLGSNNNTYHSARTMMGVFC